MEEAPGITPRTILQNWSVKRIAFCAAIQKLGEYGTAIAIVPLYQTPVGIRKPL